MMIQTTSGYVGAGDGRLYYEVAGEGEPLVLSHAGFLDSRMFDAQWQALARHFRVIRYDMRGYGRSTQVSGPLCRRDDLRRLLEHLRLTQAHLVGCSMGGEIALDLALEQPELAASLTLVGATLGGFALQGDPPRYVMDMFDAMQRGDVEGTSELQIRIWLDGSFREPDQVDRALRERALSMNRIPVERQTFGIADMQPLTPLDPPAVDRLHEINCPALIVAGSLDHPEILRAAAMMTAAIPGARQVLIDDSAHVPSFEQPDTFNRALLDFLLDQRHSRTA
jgi:pimeloyl-ACP methyl ester carboxylesterase